MTTTKTSERVLFAIILIFMLVSTVGLYASSVIGILNPSEQDIQSQQDLADLQLKINKYSQWRVGIAQKYSDIYYNQFSEYKNANSQYNSASVKELSTKDLKIGDGEEIKAGTVYRAYYIGWLPNGEVFDSSFDGEKLKMSFEATSVITGWSEGVIGMKIGGVRELTIPSSKAYGETGQGSIPANSPLKFIVMAVPQLTAEELASEPQL